MITWLIRLVVPSSMPFISDTSVASGARYGVQSARLPRSVCEGTESTTTSAPSIASAASPVAVTRSGRRIPGRYSGLCRPVRIASATAARRARTVTSRPASARILANAVPQEPAPSTATCPLIR